MGPIPTCYLDVVEVKRRTFYLHDSPAAALASGLFGVVSPQTTRRTQRDRSSAVVLPDPHLNLLVTCALHANELEALVRQAISFLRLVGATSCIAGAKNHQLVLAAVYATPSMGHAARLLIHSVPLRDPANLRACPSPSFHLLIVVVVQLCSMLRPPKAGRNGKHRKTKPNDPH